MRTTTGKQPEKQQQNQKKTTTTSRETKSNALTPIDTPADKSFLKFFILGRTQLPKNRFLSVLAF